MSRSSNHQPSPALVVALLALFVALGGGAYAATQINGKNLKDRSVAGKKLRTRLIGRCTSPKKPTHRSSSSWSRKPAPTSKPTAAPKASVWPNT